MTRFPLLSVGTAFVLASAAAGAAEQAAPAASQIDHELTRQQEIYRSRGPATPSGYTTDRALETYARGLSEGFLRTLAALRAGERWLDIGAGEGRAVLDYSTSPGYAMPEGFEPRTGVERAKVVAMSIEDRRTQAWYTATGALPPGQVEYLFGKPMGEYAVGELGRFQVITDVMGGFSYTARLSTFMERTLGALSVGGTFFTVLADVHSESTANPPHYKGAPHLTQIRAPDGSEVKICSWLKRIGCAEVACEFKTDWRPPIESYRIKKICEDVRVPALKLEHFQAGTPPERRFQLVDGPESGAPAAR